MVLLDELVKAHPEVFDVLLGVLGEGRLTDSMGRLVDLRMAVVVMTNLGAQGRAAVGFGGEAAPDFGAAVRAHFRPELIGRLDHVVSFRSLAPADIERIVDPEVAKIRRRPGLSQRGLTLWVSAPARAWLAARGFDARMGARPLRRLLEEVVVAPLAVRLAADPTALNQELQPAILCVTDKKTDITGVYSLNGQLKSKGKAESILRSLQGDVQFSARDGQILYYSILAKIFTFLSITDLLRGKLPDFAMGGFLYDSINLDGKIVDGKLTLKEFYIDGRQVDLIASGEVDLANQKIDVKVLVAPFKTVDALVRLIPPLSYVFGGNLIIVPVRVSGDLRDPKVTVLSKPPARYALPDRSTAAP